VEGWRLVIEVETRRSFFSWVLEEEREDGELDHLFSVYL